MIQISNDSFNDCIKLDSRQFKVFVSNASGVTYEVGNATITYPFSPDALTYGAVSSASISFEIENSPFAKGEVVTVKIYLAVRGVIKDEMAVKCGTFKIVEAKTLKGKQKLTKITAYDRLNFIEGKYNPDFSGNASVSILFNDICFKIIENTTSLGFPSGIAFVPYSGRLNDEEIDVSKIRGFSLRDALRFVASYVGCNVIVNRDGKIEMKPFSKVDYDLLNPDRISAPALSEADTNIQFLLAKTSDDTKVTATSTAAPKSGIIFTNPAAKASVLSKVLENETALSSYRVGTVNQILGDPRIEPGDCIALKGFEDEDINIPVMQVTFKFDGGLSAQIDSYEPEENENLTMAERIDFSLKASSDSSNYAESALNLSERINAALGLYSITVTDSMGASTYYLSDAPALEDAKYIATMTAEGFAFTSGDNCWNDGNPVWTNGIQRDGNLVMRALTAYKLTAEQIEVTDINAITAKLAQWTIKDYLIYAEGTETKKTENGTTTSTVTPGAGIVKPQNKSYLTFYAGYTPIDPDNLTETQKKNYKEKYKGSPLEYTTDWRDRVTFYVMSTGEVIAKNLTATGSMYNETTRKRVEFVNGQLLFSAKEEEGIHEKYGHITADNFGYFSGELDNSFKGKRFLRLFSDDGGVMISSNYDFFSSDDNKKFLDAKYYMFFNTPPTSGVWTNISHAFLGDSKFIGKLEAETWNFNGHSAIGNLNLKGNIDLHKDYKFKISNYDVVFINNYNNLQIGSKNIGVIKDGSITGGITVIYGGLAEQINLKNNTDVQGNLDVSGDIDMTLKKHIKINKNDAFGWSTRTVDFTDGTSTTITGLMTGILGYNHYLLGTVLFDDGTAVTSDKNFKTDIKPFDRKYEDLFSALQPKTFQYKNGTSGRTHFGFIAQELEGAIEKVGLTTKEVAAYIEAKNDEGEIELKAIRYTDIISLNTHMIQKCLAEISELKNEINSLREVKSNGEEF